MSKKSFNRTFQRLLITGRLAADPQLRYVGSGTAVCNFAVIVNGNNGSDDSDYIPCVAWENKAKSIADNLVKGDLFQFEGKLKSSTYEDTEKRKNFKLQVEVLSDKNSVFQFLEYNRQNKQENEGESSGTN